MDTPLSTREVLNRFDSHEVLDKQRFMTMESELKNLHHELLNPETGVLTEVRTGVRYTNGKMAELIKWRERVNGGAIVAGVFMSFIVMPILGWAVFTLININTSVATAVSSALSAYDIQTTK